MTTPITTFLDLSFKMHLRAWPTKQATNAKLPFLLVHGLSSNAQTWDAVGRLLSQAGHPVIAIDQRNHGLSGKTESGFDFKTVTSDIMQVIDHLNWEQPILIGQSWGGNVLTEFGARFPNRSAGLVMVDGGFLNFKATGKNWESISTEYKPPNIDRFPAETMRYFIESNHKDWSQEGVDGTMANFEIREDGLIRRRLEVSKHMEILRSIFDQDMEALYAKITDPVLICAAGPNEKPTRDKQLWLDQSSKIENSTLKWFSETDHDIHIQKPEELVAEIFSWLDTING